MKNVERGQCSVLVNVDLRTQGGHTRFLNPHADPVLHVPSGCDFQLRNQVGQCCVLVRMLGQILVQPLEEVVAAYVRNHLAQNRCAFRVGDSIEVNFNVRQIADLCFHRVCGRLLVLRQTPLFASQETDPRVTPACGFRRCKVCHVLREGLIEPEVIPPRHRDKIPEPHVRELVEDRVAA